MTKGKLSNKATPKKIKYPFAYVFNHPRPLLKKDGSQKIKSPSLIEEGARGGGYIIFLALPNT